MKTFTVNGDPIPQPRQRHRVVLPSVPELYGMCRGSNNGRELYGKLRQAVRTQNYTPKDHPVQAYKSAIRQAARLVFWSPLEGPVSVNLTLVLPRHKAKVWKTKPMPRYLSDKKPDEDNYKKAIYDALTGVAWVDDGQVAKSNFSKWHAAGGEQPHTVISIQPIRVAETPREETRSLFS